MCGIFGVLCERDSLPDELALAESIALLHHRGPDARGAHCEPGVGLASTRLSLLDPDARSDQPFVDPTGRYVLVYNGEIYNFRELARELVARGVVLRTTSDTEVVLHSLIELGPVQALGRFDGMFALALWDRRDRTLLLARDRFGMKPLYVRQGDDFFGFSSEVKAFAPWRRPAPEPAMLAAYLLGLGGATSGPTFYRDVEALAPGMLLTMREGGQPERIRFAGIPEFWSGERWSEMERFEGRRAVDRIEELLFASVERQLFADAPVGAFASGGVDSSLVAAMAARIRGDLAIFHAEVVGRWNEVHAARALASHLGLELRVVEVGEQEFVDLLPQAMRHFEQPYTYLPNCVPFMKVARLAHDHGVKGLLSGEGSDELFLGYPWFWRQPFVSAGRALARRLNRLARRLPGIASIVGPDDALRARAVRALLGGDEIAADERRVRSAVRDLATSVDSHLLASLDHLHFHLRMLLLRNDKLGMEASVEARFPFLDHEVVGAAIHLPTRFKQRFSARVLEKAHPFVRDKWVIREVAKRWVPQALAQRIKIGFWTTVFGRMEARAGYFDDSPLLQALRATGEQLRSAFESGDQDLRMRVLHLDVWTRVCIAGAAPDEVAERLRQWVSIRPE